MRFLVTARFPAEGGNAMVSDPEFGKKLEEILASQKAEAAYFLLQNGQRTCIYVIQMADASAIPSVAEPWWFLGNAHVEIALVMVKEDFAKAGPDIAAAAKKYGKK